ncbi:chaperone required for assembly of F1-ATPase [Rhizobium aethiopicum]|uniref:Chaperone required for assembly of F1-ATPase n=1 Tax=Rhizobium aethiopicum TaxID=1138170 RepID=A0A7W6QCP0_9HYPH|nr:MULTISPECIES: ATP12 family chaperone protein [Rhizobium]MBB4195100.1 chaperone required for assembly of F1-ATPase [Rhizobium aethiopicum]MBB4582659.1 chaperone required for assembly of F1-ATPase [Rhizobium aethiopicum]MDO3436919.1 ATP12 family chaperone protein [Rhizobium sp. CBN3]
MRDLLNDLSEGLSHPDPIRRAQIQMKKPLPKRFYTDVAVAEDEGSFAITLDGKSVRTPARQVLAVPTEALAQLVAAEWRRQGEEIDPVTMPVTRLVNTALDGVATNTQAIFEDILRFSSSDLICYRADGPELLVERQRERWDPIIDWAAHDLGARFILVEGVMPHEQPREATAAFAVTLARHQSPMALAALHTITTLTGSAILALALAEGRVMVEEAWSLAHLDEDWTIEHWGRDEEAEERRAKRFAEFKAAADVFFALSA